MSNSNESFKSKVALTAVVAALGAVSYDAFNSNGNVDNTNNAGLNADKQIRMNLKKDGKLDVLAGFVEISPGVNYRVSPAVENYIGADMSGSNQVSYSSLTNSGLNTLSGPVVFDRPFIKKEDDQDTSGSPTEWIGGLEDGRIIWVGLNKETAPYLHMYQRPLANGSMPKFKQEITVDHVNTSNGVEFYNGSTEASAGLIRQVSGLKDPYIEAQKMDGYKEIKNPFSDAE